MTTLRMPRRIPITRPCGGTASTGSKGRSSATVSWGVPAPRARPVGGPPIFPFVPKELLDAIERGIWRNQPDGPKVWRRSVYIYAKRSLPFPMVHVFDLADLNVSFGARNVSTVPTQALTLLNDDFVLRQAQLFADRLKKDAGEDVAKQVDLAYVLALTRHPTD